MTRYLRAMLTCIVAGSALAMVVGGASANQLAFNSTDWRFDWPRLSMSLAGSTITCPLLLEGTLHERTIDKEAGQLIGHVTDAIVGSCTGGTMTVLSEDLPWHVEFCGWEGELPFILSLCLSVDGVALQRRTSGGIACLFDMEENEPFVAIAGVELFEEGRITELDADQTAQIDLEGGFLCDLAGDTSFSGRASVETGDGDGDPLFVTLV